MSEKTIIEKLGINLKAHSSEELEEIENIYKEMLEALIDSLLLLERYERKQISHNGIGTMTDNVAERYHKIKATLEKACHPKSWEEIKELL